MENLKKIFSDTLDYVGPMIERQAEANKRFRHTVKELSDEMYNELKFLTSFGLKLEYVSPDDNRNIYLIITNGCWNYNLRISTVTTTKYINDFQITVETFKNDSAKYHLYIYNDDNYNTADNRDYDCETLVEVVKYIGQHFAYVMNKSKLK